MEGINTAAENIIIDGREFTVFRHLPYRVGAEWQGLMIACFSALDVPLGDITVEEMPVSEMAKMDWDKKRLADELLLTRAVISPNITEEVLADPNHELQPFLAPLTEKLMVLYASRQKKTTSVR